MKHVGCDLLCPVTRVVSLEIWVVSSEVSAGKIPEIDSNFYGNF